MNRQLFFYIAMQKILVTRVISMKIIFIDIFSSDLNVVFGLDGNQNFQSPNLF